MGVLIINTPFFMDIVTIGIIAAIAYFALQDGSSESGFREQPAGYNPDVSIIFSRLEQPDEIKTPTGYADSGDPTGFFNLALTFNLTNNTGKKFKNNRLAGTVFYGNQRIADFRESKNFTLNPGEVYTTDKINLRFDSLELKRAAEQQNPEFWQNIVVKGDFESRERGKEKIKFENLIDGIESGREEFKYYNLSPIDWLVKKKLGLG